MSSKYHIGETTGQKVDAVSVAKSMMTARDSNGNRMFSSSELLTSQQVSSFFSRLAWKRSLEEKVTDSEVEDDQNVENEEAYRPFEKSNSSRCCARASILLRQS